MDGTTYPLSNPAGNTCIPQPFQQCHNLACDCSPNATSHRSQLGFQGKTSPQQRCLHSTACSQHGSPSYGCMPHMPECTAPTVWVTAVWDCACGQSSQLWVWILPLRDMLLHGYQSHARSFSCRASSPLLSSLPLLLSLLSSCYCFLFFQMCYIKRENENI